MNGQMSFTSRIAIAIGTVALSYFAAIAAVRRFDLYGFHDESKIGWLSKVEGNVQVRSGDAEFRPVTTGAPLSDGDQIVTGPSSRASINFHSGRTADCLANSRITISSLEDAKSSPTILIDATRAGQTEVSLANADSKPVILLTGNGAITVSAGESVTTKSFGAAGAAEVIKKDIKTGVTTTLTKVEAAESTKIIQQALAAVATPTPAPLATPTPAPVPKIDATAILVSPKSGATLWTINPINGLAATQLPVVVSIKASPAPTNLVLELRVGPKGKGTQVPLTPTGQANTYSGKVPIGTLTESGKPQFVQGAVVYEFEVALIAGAGQAVKRIPGVGGFSIGSLSGLAQAPNTIIGLEDLTERPVVGPWIAGKTGNDPEKFPIVLTTIKAGLARPFLAPLRSAQRSGFSVNVRLGSAGTFIVKNQEVIAQIGGKGLTNAVSDRARELLDADFVYTGPQDALVSSLKYSVDQIQVLVAESVQSGKSIYVFQDQNLFQVNAEFVRKHPSVASFVRRNSSAFFTKQVKINSFR